MKSLMNKKIIIKRSDKMERFEKVNRVGILGMLANLFLFFLKIIVGFIFKSQSMVADAFNSIGDVFASLMTFIGSKIASNKDDDDHNFGHGKAEYIFSMFISVSILVIGIKLLYDSIASLVSSNKVIFSYSLLLVCVITIVIKLALYFYTKKLYKKENSILVKSNMLDHRNDVFLTSTVLIAIICSYFQIYFVDAIVGIIISIWFLLTGVKLFKESYNVLMDISLDKKTIDEIIKMILKDKRVTEVSDVHSVSVGYKFIVVLTISVDGNLKTFVSHKIANQIEKRILNNFNSIKEVFIHIHPV